MFKIQSILQKYELKVSMHTLCFFNMLLNQDLELTI